MTVLSAPTTSKGRLQRAVLEVLLSHEAAGELPTSNRFVFYELEQAGLVSKRPTGKRRPDQDTIDASFYLRDRGLVPWNWIVDETRELHEWEIADTVAGYITGLLDRTRIDPWGPLSAPLLLCESRTFGGVLSQARRKRQARLLCRCSPPSRASSEHTEVDRPPRASR